MSRLIMSKISSTKAMKTQLNVKRTGEQRFIKWVKDMVRRNSWQELLENGIFLFPLIFTTSLFRVKQTKAYIIAEAFFNF